MADTSKNKTFVFILLQKGHLVYVNCPIAATDCVRKPFFFQMSVSVVFFLLIDCCFHIEHFAGFVQYACRTRLKQQHFTFKSQNHMLLLSQMKRLINMQIKWNLCLIHFPQVRGCAAIYSLVSLFKM